MKKLINMEKYEKNGYKRVKVSIDGFRLEFLLDFTNNRIRVLEYEQLQPGRGKELFDFLEGEARRAKLGKVIVYAHAEDMNEFKNAGFCLEGSIPGYFRGSDAWCFAIFVSAGRQVGKVDQAECVLEQIPASDPVSAPITEAAGFKLYPARMDQAAELAHLYATVFSSYPTPVDDAQYIQKVMTENALFYVASYHGEIVSAASADINRKYLNAEMTDCATLPEFRERGLIMALLHALEGQLRSEGLLCLFTLARAVSPGMNKAFWRLGYRYSGRLVNNCHIAGDFEDLNIWAKYDRNQE